MSFQADLTTALASVASGRVHPNIAPENTAYPLVNYRLISKSPVAAIDGTVLSVQFQAVFECWAKNYAAALSLAGDVRAAIAASALNYYPIDEPGEEYEAQTDYYMEPVYFGFMHT